MVFGTDEISHIWDRFGVFYIFGRDYSVAYLGDT